jgi:hypothetical protein
MSSSSVRSQAIQFNHCSTENCSVLQPLIYQPHPDFGVHPPLKTFALRAGLLRILDFILRSSRMRGGQHHLFILADPNLASHVRGLAGQAAPPAWLKEARIIEPDNIVINRQARALPSTHIFSMSFEQLSALLRSLGFVKPDSTHALKSF